MAEYTQEYLPAYYTDSSPPSEYNNTSTYSSYSPGPYGHYPEERVSYTHGQPYDTGIWRSRPEHVIDVQEGPSYVVHESYKDPRTVAEYYRPLQEQVVSPQRIPQQRTFSSTQDWDDEEEEPVFYEKVVQKPVDVLVKRKIPQQRFVDVPYDVIVERPIERVVEREVEVERRVHRNIDKTVEIPVERIVQIPIEEVIERPVEVLKYINIPYERVVERPIDEIYENLVYHDTVQDIDIEDIGRFQGYETLPKEVRVQERYRHKEIPCYRENIIEEMVDVPYERVIEVPRERIVRKEVENIIEVPVYYDNVIEQLVHIPEERIIEKPVEHIVERPVFRDNIIRRPVPIEVEREEIEEVPVEHIIEEPVYIDNFIQRPVPNKIRKDIMIEKEKFIDVPNYIEHRTGIEEARPVKKQFLIEVPAIIETTREVPVEYVVRRERPIPKENHIVIEVPHFRTLPNEKVIRKEVVCEVIKEKPVPVEKEIEVVVERKIERPIYKEVIEEHEVIVDQVIEEEYDVLIPNIIKREVQKHYKIPVRRVTQKPIEKEQLYETDVTVRTDIEVPVRAGEVEERPKEIRDPDLDARTQKNRQEAIRMNNENRGLHNKITQLKERAGKTNELNSLERDKAHLKAELSELRSRLDIAQQDKQRLHGLKGEIPKKVKIDYNIPDREMGQLRNELLDLVNENNRLIEQVKRQR